MKVVVFGSEVFHSAVSQSSAYNVHTFNRSARVEETWTTVLGLSGQMHNFRSADANALFEEHHSHMRRVYPCWCDKARIVASSLISTESNQWQLYVLISVEHSSFVAMFTFAYSGACFIKRFPAWSQQVMISATDGRVSLFAWTSGHLSKVDSADQYPELMSTFPGGVIAIDAVVINKTRITAVGCGDGHVVIFRTAHCLNQVLDRLDMKLFEVPISSMVLLPDSFGEIHMLVTSAIGAIRLYSSVPEQGSPEKFVRLQASRPLDAVLCACHVRMSSSNVACNHLIYVGTFCYNFASPFWELPAKKRNSTCTANISIAETPLLGNPLPNKQCAMAGRMSRAAEKTKGNQFYKEQFCRAPLCPSKRYGIIAQNNPCVTVGYFPSKGKAVRICSNDLSTSWYAN
uniref:Uncharacterized protein n=1 Tax=Trichuris muris TaxID=70415 RepID=A0A5S6Q6T9_TRIMR